jgi:hypothetical protein
VRQLPLEGRPGSRGRGSCGKGRHGAPGWPAPGAGGWLRRGSVLGSLGSLLRNCLQPAAGSCCRGPCR